MLDLFDADGCDQPGCGAPKGRGRPRKGWVKVEGVFSDGGHDGRWYCGWNCVRELATREGGSHDHTR